MDVQNGMTLPKALMMDGLSKGQLQALYQMEADRRRALERAFWFGCLVGSMAGIAGFEIVLWLGIGK